MMADDAVLAHLRANRDRILAELVEFASIPSVSTDPAHAADIDRAARWVAAEVAAAGPFAVRTSSHRRPSGRVRRVAGRARAGRRCWSTATTTCSRPTRSRSGTARR